MESEASQNGGRCPAVSVTPRWKSKVSTRSFLRAATTSRPMPILNSLQTFNDNILHHTLLLLARWSDHPFPLSNQENAHHTPWLTPLHTKWRVMTPFGRLTGLFHLRDQVSFHRGIYSGLLSHCHHTSLPPNSLATRLTSSGYPDTLSVSPRHKSSQGSTAHSAPGSTVEPVIAMIMQRLIYSRGPMDAQWHHRIFDPRPVARHFGLGILEPLMIIHPQPLTSVTPCCVMASGTDRSLLIIVDIIGPLHILFLHTSPHLAFFSSHVFFFSTRRLFADSSLPLYFFLTDA